MADSMPRVGESWNYVASWFKNVLQWFSLPDTHTLSLFSTLIRTDLCNKQDAERMESDPWGYILKTLWPLPCFLGSFALGAASLHGMKRRDPCGKELRPTANNEHQFTSCTMSHLLQTDPIIWVEPWDDCNPDQYLNLNLMKDNEQKLPL